MHFTTGVLLLYSQTKNLTLLPTLISSVQLKFVLPTEHFSTNKVARTIFESPPEGTK